jgi:enoyl-CoA hydratase/carnithine racemase
MNEVLYEKRDRIAYITLNRPEALNALNTPLRRLLLESLQDFDRDDGLWVAIVTGAGSRAFSAGADLKEMSNRKQAELAEDYHDPFWGPQAPSLSRGLRIWKPVIAAINGYCLAGGLELALACDIRVAAEHAEFALKEVQRGIIPGGGGTQRLPRAIPLNIALELMFTGDHISAAEAHRLGLVNHVVPADQVMAKAEAIARRIGENAPLSVRAIKEAAYRGLDSSLEEGLRIEALLAKAIGFTDDSREGPRAFAEKRPAQFRGR